ncbi:hypothetical protein [Vibrio owensii]|uniref:hypothetical protein n=1 Tax=Vibrio owensii TaxID=696485 RepID=UPI0018F1A07F|nr:hypothetical protein [Vibrio owensii]
MTTNLTLNDPDNEVEFLAFSAFSKYKFSIPGFAYDHINNDIIEKALQSEEFENVNINCGWEQDTYLLNASHLDDEFKHALRIAKIINLILDGTFKFTPVNFDTHYIEKCMSGISDGHHRIRALRYLGYSEIPCYLSGSEQIIDELLYLTSIH